MAMEMMKSGWDGTAALMELCGLLPAAMQDMVLDFAERMQVVAKDHAGTVTKLEAQADALRGEIDTFAATNAEMAEAIGALGDRNQALEKAVSGLRAMNRALVGERSAFQAVEAAVARYADQKRQVDALLQAAGADAHQCGTCCAEPDEAMDASDAVDPDAPLGGNVEGASPAATVPTSAAGREAQVSAPGETAASTAHTGGKAGGRRVSGSPHVPS
jgi:hypothetical protein